MRTNKLSLGALALAGILSCTGPATASEPEKTTDKGIEATISAEDVVQLDGLERKQNSFTFEMDKWAVFGYQAKFSYPFSEFSRVGGGAEVNTKLGTFSAGVLVSQYEDLLSEGENSFFVFGYEKNKLSTSAGFGTDQVFVKGDYELSEKFSVGATYRKNLGSLDAAKPKRRISPYVQSTFFDLMPTRGDIYSLHWDEALTAYGVGGTYAGNTNASLEVLMGEMPRGRNIVPITLVRGHVSGGKTIYGSANLEMSRTEFQNSAHIFLKGGVDTKKFRGEIDFYGHGAAKEFTEIGKYYDAMGTGIEAQMKVKNDVWVGILSTIEKNNAVHNLFGRLGLSVRVGENTFFGGYSQSQEGKMRFLDIQNGFFAGVATSVLGADVCASLGKDGIGPYGSINVHFKK